MLKHRVKNLSLVEIGGVLFVVAIFLTLIGILTSLIFQDPEFLKAELNQLGLQVLNRIAIFLLHLLFFPVFAVCLLEEGSLLQSGETTFILSLPVSQLKFFIYKIIVTSARLLFPMILLAPLLFVYLFYFYNNFSFLTFIGFVLILPIILSLILFFLSSFVLLFATLKAKLMTYFRMRTLIAFSLLLFGLIVFELFLPALRAPSTEVFASPLLKVVSYRAGIMEAVSNWSPVSLLIDTSLIFSDKNFENLFYRLTKGFFGFFLALSATFFVLKRFFLEDPGFLIENIQTRQTSEQSTKYGFFLLKLPHLLRAILYDDLIHFQRLFAFYFLLIFGSVISLPLYFPNSLMSVYGSHIDILCFSNLAFFLLLSSEFLLLDFVAKDAFLPLIRSLPLGLSKFLGLKCFSQGFFLFLPQVICILCWYHVWVIEKNLLKLLFVVASFWAFSLPFLLCGVAGLVISSQNMKKEASDSKSPILLFLTSMAMFALLGSVFITIKLKYFQFLPVVFAFWIFSTLGFFFKGVNRLEEKDLN